MASNPQVSVIIPVRNGARTLARAIDSALGQRFEREFEVIVVNDGSADGTADLMLRYGDRIIVVSQEHKGLSAARNAGARIASGEYLAFLDADDEWLPQKLALVVPLLEEAPDAVLAYHDAADIDLSGQVQKRSLYQENHPPASFEEMLVPEMYKVPILPSTVVMRRATFDACGGCNEQMSTCEDVYLWIRARELGEFRFMPDALTRREFGPSPAREEWYLEGARDLNQALHEHYGSRFNGDFLYWILRWSAWAAYCRGDRRTAIRRYVAALRRNPVRLKTWLLLVLVLIPHRFIAVIARVMPGTIQRKLAQAVAVQKRLITSPNRASAGT